MFARSSVRQIAIRIVMFEKEYRGITHLSFIIILYTKRKCHFYSNIMRNEYTSLVAFEFTRNENFIRLLVRNMIFMSEETIKFKIIKLKATRYFSSAMSAKE